MKVSNCNEKISFKVNLAYGLGQVGDAIPYVLFVSFFMVYLTDIAEIPPAIAGVISAIPIFFTAFFDIVVGCISDYFKAKHGKRSALMGKIIFPYILIIAAIYIPVGGSDMFKYIYYVAIGLAYWGCFTVWVVPYLAIVVDLTNDYEERNTLRMYNNIFSMISSFIALSGSMAIKAFCLNLGYSEKTGWAISGIVCALFTGVAIIVSWYVLKGKEKEVEVEDTPRERVSIIAITKDCFKLKTFNKMMVVILVGTTIATLIDLPRMYIYLSKLEMDEATISMFFVFTFGMGLVFTVLMTKLTNRIGKREVFIAASIICMIASFVYWQIGINTFMDIVIFSLCTGFFSSTFYLLELAFAYDVAEVYAYKYRKRQDAYIVSLDNFIYKIANAITAIIVGILLSAVGYEEGGNKQTEEALEGLNTIATLPIVIMCALGCVVAYIYPVTKKKYNLLIEASVARDNNREYSEDGFKDIL